MASKKSFPRAATLRNFIHAKSPVWKQTERMGVFYAMAGANSKASRELKKAGTAVFPKRIPLLLNESSSGKQAIGTCQLVRNFRNTKRRMTSFL